MRKVEENARRHGRPETAKERRATERSFLESEGVPQTGVMAAFGRIGFSIWGVGDTGWKGRGDWLSADIGARCCVGFSLGFWGWGDLRFWRCEWEC